MKANYYLLLLFLFIIKSGSAQIIEKIYTTNQTKDSVEFTLLNFLDNIGDGTTNTSVFFYDNITNIRYLLDDSTYYYIFNNSPRVFTFYTLQIPRYNHVLLCTYSNIIYMVNMRNPLDSIINEIMSIPDIPDEYYKQCERIIKEVYYNNRKSNRIDWNYINEDIDIKEYNSNTW